MQESLKILFSLYVGFAQETARNKGYTGTVNDEITAADVQKHMRARGREEPCVE